MHAQISRICVDYVTAAMINDWIPSFLSLNISYDMQRPLYSRDPLTDAVERKKFNSVSMDEENIGFRATRFL